MARLFLDPGQTWGTISIGPSTDVIGTNSNETVYVADNGNATFDPSFNRGGDEIIFLNASDQFEGALSGANFLVTSMFGANVTIPIGSTGTTITFVDDVESNSYTLQFDGTNVTLGEQIITSTPETLDGLDAAPAPAASLGDNAPPPPEPLDDSGFITLG